MEPIKSGYTRISSILSILPSIRSINDNNEKVWGFPFQEINQEVLKRKCEIGTNVHAAINAWATNDFAPLTELERDYFESFCKWRDIVDLRPIESEMRLYDETLKITGAIDMIGKIKGSDNLILIDFKTSAQIDDKKWPLQAAFYHHLLTVNNFCVHPTVIFIRLDKDGNTPNCCAFEIDNQLKTMMISTYNIYKYLTEK